MNTVCTLRNGDSIGRGEKRLSVERGEEAKTRARALCSPALPYLVARSLTWVLRAAPLAQLSLMRIRRNSLKHDSILSVEEEESREGGDLAFQSK